MLFNRHHSHRTSLPFPSSLAKPVASVWHNLRLVVAPAIAVSCLSACAWGTVKPGKDPHHFYATQSALVQTQQQRYQSALNDKARISGARKLREQGYRQYQNGDLSAGRNSAQRHFSNARVYLPDPVLFFYLGDIALRRRLQQMETGTLYHTQSNSCWGNYQFAYEGKTILLNHYEMGLDLAEALQLDHLKSTELYQRALGTAACLSALITDTVSPVNKDTCASAARLRQCLGEPLPALPADQGL